MILMLLTAFFISDMHLSFALEYLIDMILLPQIMWAEIAMRSRTGDPIFLHFAKISLNFVANFFASDEKAEQTANFSIRDEESYGNVFARLTSTPHPRSGQHLSLSANEEDEEEKIEYSSEEISPEENADQSNEFNPSLTPRLGYSALGTG